MPTAKVNEICMYYEIEGAGEALVLITGLANDVTHHGQIVALLARRYQVLAFDNRGAGRTDKPDAPYTIEQMADDTAGLAEALNIGKAHVVGISMGGRIAMALALQHPEKVKSLVLASTFARQIQSPDRRGYSGLITRAPRYIAGPGQYPQPEYAFGRQLAASRSYDCSDCLSRISVPTLVLHGKDDTLVPRALADELHAGIAGSEMIACEGGHLFFMQQPGPFCESVTGFLDSIR